MIDEVIAEKQDDRKASVVEAQEVIAQQHQRRGRHDQDEEDEQAVEDLFMEGEQHYRNAPPRLNMAAVLAAEQNRLRVREKEREKGGANARDNNRLDFQSVQREFTFMSLQAPPSANPPSRKLCSVCLSYARYQCPKCATGLTAASRGSGKRDNPFSYFCSVECAEVHEETRCNKFVV